MKTIIVDDEPIMIRSFKRITSDINDIELIGDFGSGLDAIEFAKENEVDIAFLDIKMPDISGIETAKELKKIKENMLIVFISAYDNYLRDSNLIGADYYIMKPYKKSTIEGIISKMKLLIRNNKKHIFIQMFGRFVVFKDDEPIHLVGRAKEILALIATKSGKEISNEEIYSTLWEDREYSNVKMKVYYNAVKRLKDSLVKYGIGDLLISTARGQMLNTKIADCDFYSWQIDADSTPEDQGFEGEFLPEYSWSDYILSDIISIKKGWE